MANGRSPPSTTRARPTARRPAPAPHTATERRLNPSPQKGRPALGQIVLYYCKEGDDTPELVPFPLTPGMDVFAAIVARVHGRGLADLMVVDPSKGPMPRWKVPYSNEVKAGHWTERDGA